MEEGKWDEGPPLPSARWPCSRERGIRKGCVFCLGKVE